jgi:hypothetical protein
VNVPVPVLADVVDDRHPEHYTLRLSALRCQPSASN